MPLRPLHYIRFFLSLFLFFFSSTCAVCLGCPTVTVIILGQVGLYHRIYHYHSLFLHKFMYIHIYIYVCIWTREREIFSLILQVPRICIHTNISAGSCRLVPYM
ncbi:hypothetical protein F4703DRAFT_1821691 [Phycomyces blakesleeanus]